jgi:hypothetical protein
MQPSFWSQSDSQFVLLLLQFSVSQTVNNCNNFIPLISNSCTAHAILSKQLREVEQEVMEVSKKCSVHGLLSTTVQSNISLLEAQYE